MIWKILLISSVAGANLSILSPFIEDFVKAYGRARVESEKFNDFC